MSELHFGSGLMSRAARCLLLLRATGDRFEETVVLPAIVSVIALRLTEQGRLNPDTAVAVLMIGCASAGGYLGAVWGLSGNLRVILRGFLAGVFVASGVIATTTTNVGRPDLQVLGAQIIYITMVCFWFGQTVTASFTDIALITEEQWQSGLPRRAWLIKVTRILLGVEKLEGASAFQAIVVHIVWWVGVPTIVVRLFELFGIDLGAAIEAIKNLGFMQH